MQCFILLDGQLCVSAPIIFKLIGIVFSKIPSPSNNKIAIIEYKEN